MNVLHLDIETTGLDFDRHQVVEIGMIYDTMDRPVDELSAFQCFVKHKDFVIDPFCLKMHLNRWESIMKDGLDCSSVASAMWKWLQTLHIPQEKGRDGTWKTYLTLCGKNVAGFDYQFLRVAGIINQLRQQDYVIRHRMLDIGSLYSKSEDEFIPDLSECCKRAGFVDTEVKHNSIDDCMMTVKLLRHHWGINSFEV